MQRRPVTPFKSVRIRVQSSNLVSNVRVTYGELVVVKISPLDSENAGRSAGRAGGVCSCAPAIPGQGHRQHQQERGHARSQAGPVHAHGILSR